MKNFKGIIILLGLIMACLIVLSVFLTVELLQRKREQTNPTDTAVTTTAAASETTSGTSSGETSATSASTSTAIETTPAGTTATASQPTTSEPEVTTTAATTNTPGLITLEQAEAIALSQFDGEVRVLESEDNTDDNPPHYELELTDGQYDYEIKIHALTGAVIDYEREPIEDVDDETGD